MTKSNIKFFQVRGIGSNIPVMAVIIKPTLPKKTKVPGGDIIYDHEERIIKKAGITKSLVMLTKLNSFASNVEPKNWKGSTLQIAHEYITWNFDDLDSGDVISVEFIEKRITSPEPFED